MIDLLNWGLRTGVVITGLIGLVLLLRRPFARYFGAEATFLLWSLPLIRLCMPDIYLPKKESGIFLPYDTFPVWGSEEWGETPNSVTAPDIVSAPPPVETFFGSEFFVTAIVTIWLGGAALWLGFHLVQHFRFGRLLRDISTECPTALQQMIGRAAELTGLSKLPEIKIAPKNIGPLVSGLVNPVIILPKGFAQNYACDAQVLSLVHEFAHIKRCDLWSAFAVLLFRALHWYNPLVHYAAKRFRADLEAACDAYTLSKFAADDAAVHEYACTLLLTEQAELNRPNVPSLSLALSENYRGDLK